MKEIKNITIYNEKKIKKFLEIHYFERIKGIRLTINILIVIVILSFFTKYNKSVLDVISFVFALFGIVELNTNMIPRLNYYKLTKNKDNKINTKVTYTFKENNLKLNNKEYIDYNTLKKVIEIDDAYFLYINNNKSLIVDKTILKNEEIELLTNMFKEKVTIYKYKK